MKYSVAAFLILLTLVISAQAPVKYTLDFSNIHHHELRVSITFDEISEDQLILKMPNTSPGRYAVHNFVKNLYEEQAFDRNGQPVDFKRNTPFEWILPVNDGYVRFEYTIFGNFADGTYLGVDAQKVHMNMPATFPYADAFQDREIQLIIPQRPNWDIATQLKEINDSTFVASDYYYFYDSPTMVGEMSWRRWQVEGQTIEMAVMHQGTDQQLDDYTEWVKKIVLEQKKVFGELPKFDYGRYTFLMSYNPWVRGDAMEHRNSTVCTNTGNLAENASYLIESVAHEFFHIWNIERIRPKSLEPFNFEQPNMSDALWFGEGFTNHYDALTLCRTGIITPQKYVQELTRNINYVMNSPSREFRGPVNMSELATFTDAGTANDETNFSNTFVSYYNYGHVIGLGLDLTLRVNYNKSLDDYMKLVWEKHGKTEIPYTLTDLENLLASFTKDERFAKQFFEKQIYGSELPDFESLFAEFGIKMSLRNPQSAYFNNPRIDDGVVQTTMVRNTALYDAGVEKGDKILSINGFEIETTSDLNRVINRLEVGKTYDIVYEQLGKKVESRFTTRQDPRITLSYLPDKDLKKSQIKKRKEWLNPND